MTPTLRDLCLLIDHSICGGLRSTEFPATTAAEALSALVVPLRFASPTLTVRELTAALQEYLDNEELA